MMGAALLVWGLVLCGAGEAADPLAGFEQRLAALGRHGEELVQAQRVLEGERGRLAELAAAGRQEELEQAAGEFNRRAEDFGRRREELLAGYATLAGELGARLENERDQARRSRLLVLRAECRFAREERENALADAAAAVEAQPDGFAALSGALQIEHAFNRYASALGRADRLIALQPDNASARLARARELLALNRFAEARQALADLAAGPGTAGPEARLAAELAAEAEAWLPLWQREQELRAQEAQADDLPRVLLATAAGEIELELFENEAPNTVANFIALVERGFYDGTRFHRVVPNFMAQGGCPLSREANSPEAGRGGPGYTIPDERPADSYRRHFRGVISMASTGQPDSAGSQFFLTHCPNSSLDGGYTVFGRVVRGQEVVDELARGTLLASARVLRKRGHEYLPRTIPENGPGSAPGN